MIKIKLEQFEGPLGLLLKLIQKERLDITKISLAKIADQYIEFIRSSSQIDPDSMADFLVVAARLLLLKSRALLPFLYPEEEEEVEELERQLKIYREFLEASLKLQKMLGKKKFMFSREFKRQAVLAGQKIFSPPRKLAVDDLRAVFADLLSRLRPSQPLDEETIEHKISIEEKIAEIQNLLLRRIEVSFSHLLQTARSKTEIIVSFLAILELTKQRQILLKQDSLFTDIKISRLNL